MVTWREFNPPLELVPHRSRYLLISLLLAGACVLPSAAHAQTALPTESGVSDYIAQTEREAYGKLREICETVNQRRVVDRQSWLDWTQPEEPAYPATDLYGIVSADDRIPFDATEIIARIVDGSRFSAFKPEWGESVVCGFARVWGHLVGVIANKRHHLQRVRTQGNALQRAVRAAP